MFDDMYISLKTLLEFCHNTTDHCVTPNDLMRMNTLSLPIPVQQEAHSKATVNDVIEAMHKWAYKHVKLGDTILMTPSQVMDTLMEAWGLDKKGD